MTPMELQSVFGKIHAKVYKFTDLVPDGETPEVYITVKFAEAISNNLVDCIVTELKSVWYVYTQTPHTLTEADFSLVAELPLPEPEPLPEPLPEPVETPATEETV